MVKCLRERPRSLLRFIMCIAHYEAYCCDKFVGGIPRILIEFHLYDEICKQHTLHYLFHFDTFIKKRRRDDNGTEVNDQYTY